jgi:hypothetical protein
MKPRRSVADEDITKGKKKRTRRTATVHFYENLGKPARSRSEALAEIRRDEAEECATPDAVKGTAGNPVPPSPGSRPVTDRLSPSRVTGGAAPSAGDHNAAAFNDPMNQPGPRALAYRHENLRQGATNPLPLVAMTTQVGDNQNHDRDVTYWAGRVALDRLDAAAAAGMPSAPGNPASRPMPHSAPIGANNGTHGLADVVSRGAPMATKAQTGSEALSVMRDTQRRLG